MDVHHRLAGGGADVDADVVAGRVELFVEEGFRLPDEGEEGGLLRIGRVEEVCDVAEGDEEEVAGTRGVPVIAGVAEVVLQDYVFWRWVAEGTGQSVHASYPRTWMR